MADQDGSGRAGGFLADSSGARWTYAGALTFAEAAAALSSASALPLPRDGVVDCGGIGAFDSAAVAVMLSLRRRASDEGKPLAFAGLPARLEALATLYDVEEMLAG